MPPPPVAVGSRYSSPRGNDCSGEIHLSPTHRILTNGLTQGQLATLTSVSDELREQQQEVARLSSAYQRLLTELDAKNGLLAAKDSRIEELLRGEAADVTAFKEKQRQSWSRLEATAAALSQELQQKESDLQASRLDNAQLSQKNTLLQLKVDELQDKMARGGMDLGSLQEGYQGEKGRLQARITELQQELAASEAGQMALRDDLTRAKEAQRDAEQRAEQAEKEMNRAQQDLRFFRSTTVAEMEKQQVLLAQANEDAQRAAAELQTAKAEAVGLAARLSTAEMTVQQQELDITRAQQEIARLREELDVARRVQGELHVQMRKLEVVNQQRDAAVSDLRQQLQEGARANDLTHQQVQAAADRLRRAEDGTAQVIRDAQDPSPSRSAAAGVVPSTPRVAHDGPADLVAEVGRAEQAWEQLHAMVQKQLWEKESAAQAAKQAKDDAADKLHASEQRAGRAEKLADHREQLLDTNCEEEDKRAALRRDEGAAWRDLAGSVAAAKQAVLRERAAHLERTEGRYRGAIGRWSEAEMAALHGARGQGAVALHAHTLHRQLQAPLPDGDRLHEPLGSPPRHYSTAFTPTAGLHRSPPPVHPPPGSVLSDGSAPARRGDSGVGGGSRRLDSGRFTASAPDRRQSGRASDSERGERGVRTGTGSGLSNRLPSARSVR